MWRGSQRRRKIYGRQVPREYGIHVKVEKEVWGRRKKVVEILEIAGKRTGAKKKKKAKELQCTRMW